MIQSIFVDRSLCNVMMIMMHGTVNYLQAYDGGTGGAACSSLAGTRRVACA